MYLRYSIRKKDGKVHRYWGAWCAAFESDAV
jgi:hypothetical protein